jgi:hypothetical protein
MGGGREPGRVATGLGDDHLRGIRSVSPWQQSSGTRDPRAIHPSGLAHTLCVPASSGPHHHSHQPAKRSKIATEHTWCTVCGVRERRASSWRLWLV